MYDTNRSAILKWNMMELSVDGNSWVGVQNCGGEMVSIHAVRKRAAGFSNVKSIPYITLELVDKVCRLAVSMSSYGVSEVGT